MLLKLFTLYILLFNSKAMNEEVKQDFMRHTTPIIMHAAPAHGRPYVSQSNIIKLMLTFACLGTYMVNAADENNTATEYNFACFHAKKPVFSVTSNQTASELEKTNLLAQVDRNKIEVIDFPLSKLGNYSRECEEMDKKEEKCNYVNNFIYSTYVKELKFIYFIPKKSLEELSKFNFLYYEEGSPIFKIQAESFEELVHTFCYIKFLASESKQEKEFFKCLSIKN